MAFGSDARFKMDSASVARFQGLYYQEMVNTGADPSCIGVCQNVQAVNQGNYGNPSRMVSPVLQQQQQVLKQFVEYPGPCPLTNNIYGQCHQVGPRNAFTPFVGPTSQTLKPAGFTNGNYNMLNHQAQPMNKTINGSLNQSNNMHNYNIFNHQMQTMNNTSSVFPRSNNWHSYMLNNLSQITNRSNSSLSQNNDNLRNCSGFDNRTQTMNETNSLFAKSNDSHDCNEFNDQTQIADKTNSAPWQNNNWHVSNEIKSNPSFEATCIPMRNEDDKSNLNGNVSHNGINTDIDMLPQGFCEPRTDTLRTVNIEAKFDNYKTETNFDRNIARQIPEIENARLNNAMKTNSEKAFSMNNNMRIENQSYGNCHESESTDNFRTFGNRFSVDTETDPQLHTSIPKTLNTLSDAGTSLHESENAANKSDVQDAVSSSPKFSTDSCFEFESTDINNNDIEKGKFKEVSEEIIIKDDDSDEDHECVQSQLYIGNLTVNTSLKEVKTLLKDYKIHQVWFGFHKYKIKDICALVKVSSLKETRRIIKENKEAFLRGHCLKLRFAASRDFEDYNIAKTTEKITTGDHLQKAYLPNLSGSNLRQIAANHIRNIEQNSNTEINCPYKGTTMTLQAPKQNVDLHSEIHRDLRNEINRDLRIEINRDPRNEIHRDPRNEINRDPRNEIHTDSRNEIRRDSRNEIHTDSRNEIHTDSRNEIHTDSRNEIRRDSRNEIHTDSRNEICRDSRNEIQRDSRNEIHRDPRNEIYRDPRNEIRRDSRNEIHRDSRNEIHRDPRNEIHRNPRNEIYRDPRNEIHRDPRSSQRASLHISESRENKGKHQKGSESQAGRSLDKYSNIPSHKQAIQSELLTKQDVDSAFRDEIMKLDETSKQRSDKHKPSSTHDQVSLYNHEEDLLRELGVVVHKLGAQMVLNKLGEQNFPLTNDRIPRYGHEKKYLDKERQTQSYKPEEMQDHQGRHMAGKERDLKSHHKEGKHQKYVEKQTDLRLQPNQSDHKLADQSPPPKQAYQRLQANQDDQIKPAKNAYQIQPTKQAYQIKLTKQAYQIEPPKQAYQMLQTNEDDQNQPPKHANQIQPPEQAYKRLQANQADQNQPPKQAYQIQPPKQAYQIQPPKQAYQVQPPKQVYQRLQANDDDNQNQPPKQVYQRLQANDDNQNQPQKQAYQRLQGNEDNLYHQPPKQAYQIQPPKQAYQKLPFKQIDLFPLTCEQKNDQTVHKEQTSATLQEGETSVVQEPDLDNIYIYKLLKMKCSNKPVIGLQYIQETIMTGFEEAITYQCKLCSLTFLSSTICDHLIGSEHRLKYLEKHHRDVWKEVEHCAEMLEVYCCWVDGTYGREDCTVCTFMVNGRDRNRPVYTSCNTVRDLKYTSPWKGIYDLKALRIMSQTRLSGNHGNKVTEVYCVNVETRENVKDLVTQLADNVKGIVPPAADNVKGIVPLAADNVKGNVPPAADSVKGIVPPVADNVKGIVPPVAENVKGIVPPVAENVKGIVPPVTDNVKGIVPPVAENVKGIVPQEADTNNNEVETCSQIVTSTGDDVSNNNKVIDSANADSANTAGEVDKKSIWKHELEKIEKGVYSKSIVKCERMSKFLTVYMGESYRTALIGLKEVIELQQADINAEPCYLCFLCQKALSWQAVFQHMTSAEHRLQYMKCNYPYLYNLVTSNSSASLSIEGFAKEIAVIEGDRGDLEVMIVVPPCTVRLEGDTSGGSETVDKNMVVGKRTRNSEESPKTKRKVQKESDCQNVPNNNEKDNEDLGKRDRKGLKCREKKYTTEQDLNSGRHTDTLEKVKVLSCKNKVSDKNSYSEVEKGNEKSVGKRSKSEKINDRENADTICVAANIQIKRKLNVENEGEECVGKLTSDSPKSKRMKKYSVLTTDLKREERSKEVSIREHSNTSVKLDKNGETLREQGTLSIKESRGESMRKQGTMSVKESRGETKKKQGTMSVKQERKGDSLTQLIGEWPHTSVIGLSFVCEVKHCTRKDRPSLYRCILCDETRGKYLVAMEMLHHVCSRTHRESFFKTMRHDLYEEMLSKAMDEISFNSLLDQYAQLFQEEMCNDIKTEVSEDNSLWQNYFSTDKQGSRSLRTFVPLTEACLPVKICHFVSPSEIHLQLMKTDRVACRGLMKNMQVAYKNSKCNREDKWEVGMFCAAFLMQENLWYRGKIMQAITTKSQGFQVFLIDYGSTHKVSGHNLRKIDQEFYGIACLSFCCTLHHLKPDNGQEEWPMSTNMLVRNIIHERNLFIEKKIEKMDPKLILLVNEYFTKNLEAVFMATKSAKSQYGKLPVDLLIENVDKKTKEKTYRSLSLFLQQEGLAVRNG